MTRFIFARVIGAVLTIWLMSVIIFGSLYLVPGNYVTFLTGGAPITGQQRAAIIAEFHLNEGFLPRYVSWFGGLLQGKLGYSLVYHESVSTLLGGRIGITAMLVAMSFLLMCVIGVGGGVLAGLERGWADSVSTAVATIGFSVPAFAAAIFIAVVFAVDLGWFPAYGGGSGFADEAYHLVLPATALALSYIGYILRTTRGTIRADAEREHVDMAYGRGLRPAIVVRRHVLRNSFLPITTVVAVGFGGLVAGTVVVETAFGLSGLGSLLVSSVLEKDFAVVQAISLIFVVTFVVLNCAVDILYVVADPRTRRKVIAGA